MLFLWRTAWEEGASRRIVIDLVEGGRRVTEVASDLGICEQTICTWRRPDQIDGSPNCRATVLLMAQVIGLDGGAGEWFADALDEVWVGGDAAFPIDPRLPEPTRRTLLDNIRPSEIWGPDRRIHLDGRETEDGDALIMATSGTTGIAKGIVLTHDAVAAAAEITSEALAVDPSVDKWALCLPVSHMGGLGVLTRAKLTATPIVMTDRFDADWVRQAASDGANLISLVPASLSQVDDEHFRAILLGGSSIPPDRPPNAIATYGLTESAGGVIYDGLPLRDVQMRVIDGQVHLKSPTLLRCYRDGTDPKTANGWLATGDLGEIDQGVLTIHGRAFDIIVTGGEKVWPAMVEAVLATLPTVAEVAVVGRPDERWGQAVTAVVVPLDPTAPPNLEELRDAVKDRLPAYAAPNRVELVDALPRNSLGKVLRSAL